MNVKTNHDLHPISQPGFFKRLLDNMQIGIIVIDAVGQIIYINDTYARFVDVDIELSLGKHVTEVVANSRLHIVAKSGVAEINHPHKFKGMGLVVQRVPIKQSGKVIAALGLVLFDSATTAHKLAEKVAFLETKIQQFQNELASMYSTRYTFNHIIGPSPSMQKLKQEAMQVAAHDMPVLITGESGTGKELFAQAIHDASPRRSNPFLRVNCTALPKDLLESELFGYEKGSFTGAHPKGKPGKFELAHMGTIFLDEIGDMPIEMQPKLLRVLELKEFERIGGVNIVASDFRVIAATNQDLNRLMKSGLFRRDLYYRLNGVPIQIEPLRKRPSDILPLAYHYIEKTIKGPTGKGIRIHPKACLKLERYDWPGNGRELLHAIQRAIYRADQKMIAPKHLPEYIRHSVQFPHKESDASLSKYLQGAEKYAIRQALDQANGNKTVAARNLGIHRTLIYRKMKLLGM